MEPKHRNSDSNLRTLVSRRFIDMAPSPVFEEPNSRGSMDLPNGGKLAYVPGNNYELKTTRLGHKLNKSAGKEFSTSFYPESALDYTYRSIQDPHLKDYFYKNEQHLNLMLKLHEIDDKGNTCGNLKEFNQYRTYLQRLNIQFMNEKYRDHINRVRYANMITRREIKIQHQIIRESEAVHREIGKRRREVAVESERRRMREILARMDEEGREEWRRKLEQVIRAPMRAHFERRRIVKRRQEQQKDKIDRYVKEVRQEVVDIKNEKLLIKGLQRAQARYNWLQRRMDERTEFFEQKQRYHEAKMNQLVDENENNALRKMCRVEWWKTYYDKNYRADKEHLRYILDGAEHKRTHQNQLITQSLMLRGVSESYCWYPRQEKELIERIQVEMKKNKNKFNGMSRSKIANSIYCKIKEEGVLELANRAQARDLRSQASDITCHAVALSRRVLRREGYDRYSSVVTPHLHAICDVIAREISLVARPPRQTPGLDPKKLSDAKRMRLELEKLDKYEKKVVDVKEAVEEVMRAMFGRVLLQITQIIDQIEYQDENYRSELAELTASDPRRESEDALLDEEARSELKRRIATVTDVIATPILSGKWTESRERQLTRDHDLLSPALSLLAADVTDDVTQKIKQENEPVVEERGRPVAKIGETKEAPAKKKTKKSKKKEEKVVKVEKECSVVSETRTDLAELRFAASKLVSVLAEDMVARNPDREPTEPLVVPEDEPFPFEPRVPQRFQPPDLTRSKLHVYAVDAIASKLAERALRKMEDQPDDVEDKDEAPINEGEEMNFAVEALADELTLKLMMLQREDEEKAARSPQPGDIEPISVVSGEESDDVDDDDVERRRRKERGETLVSSLVFELAREVLAKTCDVIVQRKLPECEEEAGGVTSEAIEILALRLTEHSRLRHNEAKRQGFDAGDERLGLNSVAIGHVMTSLADIIMDVAFIVSHNQEEQERADRDEEDEEEAEVETRVSLESVTSVLSKAINIVTSAHLNNKLSAVPGNFKEEELYHHMREIEDEGFEPSRVSDEESDDVSSGNQSTASKLHQVMSLLTTEILHEAQERFESKLKEIDEDRQYKPRKKKSNGDEKFLEQYKEITGVCCDWLNLADLGFKSDSDQGRIHSGIVLAVQRLTSLLHQGHKDEIFNKSDNEREHRQLCIKFANNPLGAARMARELRTSQSKTGFGRSRFPRRMQNHINASLQLTSSEVVDRLKRAKKRPSAVEFEGLLQFVVSHAVLDSLACQINELVRLSMGGKRVKKDRLSRHTYVMVGSIVNLKCSTIGSWPKLKPCQMRPEAKEDLLVIRRNKELESMMDTKKMTPKEREIKAAGIKTKIICGFEPGSVKCFVESKANYDAYKQSNFCWKKNLTKQVEQSKEIRKSLMYHRKSTEGDDFDTDDDVPSSTIALLAMYDDDDEYLEWADETDRMCDVMAWHFVDDVIDEMAEGGEFDQPPPPIVERKLEPFDPVFNRTMREMKKMLRFVEEKKREERLEQKRLKEEELAREEEEKLRELRALQQEEEDEETASQQQESEKEYQNKEVSGNGEGDYEDENQDERTDDEDEDDDHEFSSNSEKKAVEGIVPEPSTGVQLLEKLILDDDEYTSQFSSDVETLKISLAKSTQIDDDVYTSSARTSCYDSKEKSTGSERALYPVSKAFKTSKESRARLPNIDSVPTSASSLHSSQSSNHNSARRVSSGNIMRCAERAAKAYQASIIRNRKRSEARNARCEKSRSSHKTRGRPDWSNSTTKPYDSSKRRPNGDSDRENFEQTLRLARVAYQTSSSSSFSKLSKRGRSVTGARKKSAPLSAKPSDLAIEHSYSEESFEQISSSDGDSSSSSGESERDRNDSKRDSIVRFESAASGMVLRALDVNAMTSSASRSSVTSPTTTTTTTTVRRRRRNALSSSKLSDHRPLRRSAMTSCLSDVTSRYSDVTTTSSVRFSVSGAPRKAINRRSASRKSASSDQSSGDEESVHCSSGSGSEASSIEECFSGY